MRASEHSWLKRLEAVLTTEVSSRSLGLLRIFAALSIWVEFASPWVAHRMDDYLGTLLCSWGVLFPIWLVIFGYKTRWAASIVALSFAGLHLYYGIHVGVEKLVYPVQEFQVAVLLAVTPCGRSLSVDRALEVRRAKREGRAPAPETVPWWMLELFILQTASVYLWQAIDGTEAAWLDGTTLELYIMQWYGSADIFELHPRFHDFVVGLSWATTAIAFVLAFGLLIRPLRPYLMWVAALFVFAHMLAFAHNYANSYLYLMMLTLLIACVPPAWIHQLVSYQSPSSARGEDDHGNQPART
jgi:hypothetical protein